MLDGVERQSTGSLRRIVPKVTRRPSVSDLVQRDGKQQRDRAEQNPLDVECWHRRIIRGSQWGCGAVTARGIRRLRGAVVDGPGRIATRSAGTRTDLENGILLKNL